jgi:hypothetical protein
MTTKKPILVGWDATALLFFDQFGGDFLAQARMCDVCWGAIFPIT